MTREELVRALRLNLAAEHEAVHEYTAHADATDDPLARAVLLDIANEERVHAGEFARLIAILTKDEDLFLAKGAAEVDEVVRELAAAIHEVCGGSERSGAGRGEAGTQVPQPGLTTAGALAPPPSGAAGGRQHQSSGEGNLPQSSGRRTTIGSLRM